MQTSGDALEAATATLRDYDRAAEEYWAGTKDQYLGADYDWFLSFLKGDSPFDLLDLGCGPGRDLIQLRRRSHRVVGLDGSAAMVTLARRHAGGPVLHQNFLSLRLGAERFDGVFANASLFHIPPDALPQVLARLYRALRPQGILYSLNPRGRNQSGWAGDRFCAYHSVAAWRRFLRAAGFRERGCELRPIGVDRASQRWVASIWQKTG